MSANASDKGLAPVVEGDSVRVPPTDAKGRPLPEDMTDREIEIETLYHMRNLMDVFDALGKHPMAASFGMAFPSNPRG